LKRRQYDSALKAGFATPGYPGYSGFNYSQNDIFRSIFEDPIFFANLSNMFRESGLRFDEAIVAYVRRQIQQAIGEPTAEEIKIKAKTSFVAFLGEDLLHVEPVAVVPNSKF
jgi:hypothetical protein